MTDFYKKTYHLSWDQNMGGGRGTIIEIESVDIDSIKFIWNMLCKNRLENEVRNVKLFSKELNQKIKTCKNLNSPKAWLNLKT